MTPSKKGKIPLLKFSCLQKNIVDYNMSENLLRVILGEERLCCKEPKR